MTDPDQDPTLELRLLGPLSVVVDGQPVSVGGPRQMAVLARLMLTPDQMVTMGQLVESVWDGDEPAHPPIAIRSYVSNLRRAIEPNRRRRAADSCLASAPPGYRLAVDPLSVDWVQFEALVNQGRAELEADRCRAAVGKIRSALELWKGEPCAGLPESHTFLAHSGRLTKLRESAIELLFDALLRQGDHGTVAAEVEAAIDENPLRERLTELGMIAFYRAGRQSEALGLGRLLRTRLREELGINPRPSIEAMELKILNHDQSLALQVIPPVMPSERGALPDGAPISAESLPELGALPTSVCRTVRPTARFTRRPAAQALHGLDSKPIDHNQLADSKQTVAKTKSNRPTTGTEVNGSRKGGHELSSNGTSSAVPIGRERPQSPVPHPVGEPSWGATPATAAMKPNVNLLSAPRAPFGRRAELNTLESIGERLAAGASATAIITGEQGIGKTTIVRSVAAKLADQGAVVTWSRCVQEPSAPLWSVAQAVLSLIEQRNDEPALELTSDLAPLAGLGPSVAGVLSAPAGITYEHAEVMLAVTRLLKRLAERSPVVLIFEDLQWADPQTVSALHYAASSLADLPVGFLLTWRETDLANGTPAANLRELSRLHPLIRVELEGIDAPAIVELARSVGRPLTAGETKQVHQRCGGNPLFVKEVLAHPDLAPAQGRRRTTLIDVVLDRVERLHSDAGSVLAAASLSLRPFTLDFLTQLSGQDAGVAQLVLSRAVRGGVLEEVVRPEGAFRFRHPVMAEVLGSELLSVDRTAMHRMAGHRRLAEDGPSLEVAHHLSQSPEPADRLRAARIALDLLAGAPPDPGPGLDPVTTTPDPAALRQVADHVAVAEATMTEFPDLRAGRWRDALMIDIGCYRAWRAGIDGKPDVWEERAVAALRLGLNAVDRPASGRASSDPTNPEPDIERCLGTAAMTMAGVPRYPVGPTRTGGFIRMKPETEELLQRAVERLSNDQVARWAVQVYLQARAAEAKPGPTNQRKALRESSKTLTAARKKLPSSEIPVVVEAHLREFAELLEPQARLQLIEELRVLSPTFSSRLTEVRFGYPALLELGRSLDAELMARKLLDDANDNNVGLFERTEAQVLMARHLLWAGQLEAADGLITDALAGWQGQGFAQPVPLVRQLRAVRLLSKVALPGGHGPDEHHQLLAERATSPELAFRLARLGDLTRAGQCLDQLMEFVGVRQIPLSDQAFVAMAARLADHEKAALMVLDLLKQAGDQPVARSDGSVIFGPASLYASLAASAAGRSQEANRYLDAAAAALQRFGGSPASLHVVASDLEIPKDSNPAPTNS